MRKNKKFNCLFKQSGETYKLYIHDAIYHGDPKYGDDTNAKYIVEKLSEIPDGSTLEVHINSDGGDAFEGTAIYNVLKNAPIKKIGIVDGHAFSAATFILMACDDRVMSTGTTLLIHNAWTIAIGNADDLRAVADDLDKLMESNRNIFLERCSMSEDELIALMKEDRMLTPKEALEYGFIDRIGDMKTDDPDDDLDDSQGASVLDNDEGVPDDDTDGTDDDAKDDSDQDDPVDDEDDAQALRNDRMMAAQRFFKQYF